MKSDIPPRDYPITQTTIAMVEAFMSSDFAKYQRERNILQAYIDNLDSMLKVTQGGARC
jgi:hypothetical protein